MDPVTLVVVPGFLGGLIVALVLFRMQAPQSAVDPLTRQWLSSDVINIAHIHVAGVGGLGLVAMAATVAWFVPRIRQTVGVGVALGFIMAAILIYRRRKSGGGR